MPGDGLRVRHAVQASVRDKQYEEKVSESMSEVCSAESEESV